jgi:hypothetical protein
MKTKRDVALILLIGFILVTFIILLDPKVRKGKELNKNHTSYNVENIQIDTTSNKWFGIPVVEVEKVNQKQGKYSVTLENGILFYSNKKYSIGEMGAWINNTDSIIFENPEIKKIW